MLGTGKIVGNVLVDNIPEIIKPFTILVKKLIVTNKTSEWCKLPYPNHPKGCPNYNKKLFCPPNHIDINKYFDLSKPLYFVFAEFDLEKHSKRMKVLHPNWTERQCKCCLYWQSKVRKQLTENIKLVSMVLGTDRTTSCPEAMGVNVFATCALSGLKLERTRDLKIDRHIALIGYKIGE